MTNEYSLVASAAAAVNSGNVTAGRPSPKASLVLGPFARTELFANFGAGFHSNDARGVTTRFDQSSVALWRLDLGSELVFSGDAGTTEPSRPSRRQGIGVTTVSPAQPDTDEAG